MVEKVLLCCGRKRCPDAKIDRSNESISLTDEDQNIKTPFVLKFDQLEVLYKKVFSSKQT